MPLRILDRVVVFDYGEVISRSPSDRDRDELLALAGADAEPFWASYWSHRDALDRGDLSVTDYWGTIAVEVSADWTPGTVQQLWAADFRSWISVEPGTVDLLASMHEGGTRLALLSNAGFDFADPFRFSPMGQYFERIFVSAEMNALKPEPEIYELTLVRLGVSAAEALLIDDVELNCDGARELGIRSIWFRDTEQAIAETEAVLAGP